MKAFGRIAFFMMLTAMPVLFSGCLMLDVLLLAAEGIYYSSACYSSVNTSGSIRGGGDVSYSDIRKVLKLTGEKVHDRDGDGKVNCIDYTLTFKKEWDRILPASRCEIVRNYHETRLKSTSMNHLFVRVRLDTHDGWIYVEPQARYDSSDYKMSDYWGMKYNPSYNNYGETAYWLAECRR
jgi:hypothetical protein